MNIQSAFQHLPVSALIVDQNRKVLAMNEEAEALLGLKAEEVVGKKTCLELCRCQIPESECPLFKAFRRNAPVYRTEVPMVLEDSRHLMVERVSPYVDAQSGQELGVLVLGDATRHLRRLRKLRHAAHRDRLTGLFNRSYFDEIFGRAAHAERRQTMAAFLMLDVDKLKAVNDRFGHKAGDRLLRMVGWVLHRTSRSSDLVGRLGGDEFGIYCAHTTGAEADHLAQRIQQTIAKLNARHPALPALRVGIGIASSSDLAPQDLRDQADQELYRYKRSRASFCSLV